VPQPLPPHKLRPELPPGALPFADTSELEPLDAIVGQDGALAAIRQAVEMTTPGYNLFVVGLGGGGRLQTVRRVLEGLAPRRRVRRDFVYVHNHDDPGRPCLLSLPPGAGPRLKRELHDLREALFREIPRILESDAVRTARDRLLRGLEREQRALIVGLQERVREEGFELGGDEDDEDGLPIVVLVTDDGPVGRAEALLQAEQGRIEVPVDELEARFDRFEDELAHTLAAARRGAHAAHKAVLEVEQGAVREGTAPLFQDAGGRFRAVRSWLKALHEAAVEHFEVFRPSDDEDDDDGPDGMTILSAFTVNVLHRGSRSRKAPIVVAPDPTFGTLFGGVVPDGPLMRGADHTHLRAGALHDADGGFLVVNAADMVSEPGVWKTLKRAMTFGELGIQNLDAATQGSPPPLRPDPAPLDVKVVLLGDDDVYTLLSAADPDFASVFKIKAEFEDSAPLTAELALDTTRALVRLQRREKLRPMTRDAVAELLLHGVRESGLPGRLRLAMGALADVMREADYQAAGERVQRDDIRTALAAREERHGSYRRYLDDALARGTLHVATTGEATGQVNGLAVIDPGGARFGRPLRITATAGASRNGRVINIERESQLSGSSHDKGVLVLTGYLRGRYGRHRTLAMQASLAIEQHHAGIDGDSASAAELVALLSAISAVPVRQDRALTGSIDQHGSVRPVGGVSEKVEGFHGLCALRGLTGEQGVLLPAASVGDLCLSPAVVADCQAGRFHVWAVETIEDVMDLLIPGGAEHMHTEALEALGLFERVARPSRRREDYR
jgi:predicted ATP-dependent protease